jgi:rRNA-processing protein FCF1
MKKVLLDTNFILSCIRKKIDFFNDLKFCGFKILIPAEIIVELEKISKTGGKKFQEESKIALNLIKQNDFEKINLNTKNVDNGIVKIAGENEEYIIATLDREIKSKIENQKLVIRGNGKLEIV